MRVCQGVSRRQRDRARTPRRGAESAGAVSALRVLIADASADPEGRRPAGAGSGTRVRCARWRTPAATPGRACCWCPRGTLARAGGTGGGWRTGWRAHAARAGPPGCKGAVLVRAPVAPGSAIALTVWSPRGCAAALMRRHADGRGERRFPVVLPRHAASRAVPGSFTPLRPFGCDLPLTAGLPVRSCRSPRPSGAGCGVLEGAGPWVLDTRTGRASMPR